MINTLRLLSLETLYDDLSDLEKEKFLKRIVEKARGGPLKVILEKCHKTHRKSIRDFIAAFGKCKDKDSDLAENQDDFDEEILKQEDKIEDTYGRIGKHIHFRFYIDIFELQFYSGYFNPTDKDPCRFCGERITFVFNFRWEDLGKVSVLCRKEEDEEGVIDKDGLFKELKKISYFSYKKCYTCEINTDY